ncbi:hypothetical protein RND71_008831 [Anisodus tanguticus]|uniref:Protein arginine N-methyltransferase domain-containing protein n=1 Tax=Anisodus tanguticus TaxID=243964 RepID=A0AAE1VLF6_9SOLA|nr:hypothetical protein RND71_008831 [Anisodus tanguticus]
MLQPTDGGYTNGYHQAGGGGGNRVRRGSRGRSRVRRGGGGGSDGSGARASQWQQQHEDEEEREKPATPCTDFDTAYFHSYAHVGIHEEMIKDRVRTDSYRNAIFQHQNFIAGKVVVDVGCGTGILSIFCAQAGARRVYAVDASDIAVQANEIVKANNLSDKVIVLHGRVEDVEIDEEVDVIVSEWMGYMLLYESMLGSVITARDRWLKPGGLVLPSHATVLYMAPVTHPDRYSESVDFWHNIYGIDNSVGVPFFVVSAIIPLAKQCAFEEPSVETITVENVLTWPQVWSYDLILIFVSAPFHGFAFWFDVEFTGPTVLPLNNDMPPSFIEPSNSYMTEGNHRKKRPNPNEALVLSTAPEDPPTHWQQTLVYFYEPLDVEQDQVIEGSLTLSQSKENARFMNIHLEYSSGGRSFVKESVMR